MPIPLITAALGAVIGGGIEAGMQLYQHGEIKDWKAVGGAALQGGITGAVAGATGGTSLLATTGANVVGGLANRAIQGKENTVANVVTDAAVGLAVGVGGKALNSAKSAVTEMVTVHRGVNSTSPAFAAAENGVVKPRGGILGHSSPSAHNAGNTANSKMTSWTTDPRVAQHYATTGSNNGVVLSQQIPKSSLIASPNSHNVLLKSKVVISESEVLLKGTQRNLNVETIKR